jgi:DNA-binding response OmpR family regulator
MVLDVSELSADALSSSAHGRKVIHAAGILIVQSDAEVASVWREALIDFGMTGARAVVTVEEALDSIVASPPSGIVVALTPVSESHRLMSKLMAREAGDMSDVPILLVTPQPTRSIVVAAANAGFDGVLPYPPSPRMIYRRMGSLMQKARRSMRKRGGPLIGELTPVREAVPSRGRASDGVW